MLHQVVQEIEGAGLDVDGLARVPELVAGRVQLEFLEAIDLAGHSARL
jgi:hypothetical protein